MIEPIYKIGDVVFCVKEYRVIKATVIKITQTINAQGEMLIYTIKPFKGSKDIQASPAELLTDFEKARQSALANWRTITQNVEKSLKNLTEKDYEPDEKTEK